jgi:hypothetical protein
VRLSPRSPRAGADPVDDAGARWAGTFSARIARVLRDVAPNLAPRSLDAIATTVVHLVSGRLLVAVSGSRAKQACLVEETKFALRGYLALRLPHALAEAAARSAKA